MKKILLISAAAALLLTGCGSERKAEKPMVIREDMDCTMKATIDSRSYTAKLRRGGADIWECEFTEPECISGLKLTTSGEICRMEFMGLEHTAPMESLPEYCMVPLITKSLDVMISGDGVNCISKEGIITERGTVNGLKFTGKVSGGEVTDLDIQGYLSAEFT
ncbi:MAG: hypothetical protein J6I46_03635 [Ruminococcus sp.]|nr:hypothetical protein [Ruminococcus sp.]